MSRNVPVEHITARQETAALRDFDPAYDRCGSFTTDAVEATPVCPEKLDSAIAVIQSAEKRRRHSFFWSAEPQWR
jgi:hypothetical protein